MVKIYLASKSPRRKEILQNAGFELELVDIDVEETYPSDLPKEEVAEFLAVKKADGLKDLPNDGLLLTADTIVLQDGEILGKPESVEDARTTLRKLSGKRHQVITGFCLRDMGQSKSFSDVSEVFFATLTEAEIENYVQSPDPHDKAGSYGIQSGLGMVAVEKIVGSYFTIMGLPIHRVYAEVMSWEQKA